MSYWEERIVSAQDKISEKSIKDIEKQLRKYYSYSMNSVINEFISLYESILRAQEEGKQPTASDLYKLDRYWELQAQLQRKLNELGDKENSLLSQSFEKTYIDIYNSINLPVDQMFKTISAQDARTAINTVWVADGKNFSQRVWQNTQNLVEAINQELVNCVITGKKTTELKQLLMAQYNVSYHQAETLVRTEIAHIQNESATARYKDAGVKKFKVLGRTESPLKCDCAQLNGKVFRFDDPNAPTFPRHPNCRCAIAPVISHKKIEYNGTKKVEQ